jgi:hypothetical protein
MYVTMATPTLRHCPSERSTWPTQIVEPIRTRRDRATNRPFRDRTEVSRAVQEVGTHAALDGETVAVDAHQFQPKQVIEGMPGKEFLSYLGVAFRFAQVW